MREKPHQVGRLQDLAKNEEETEARRAEEQSARNARMLYQLQQMVRFCLTTLSLPPSLVFLSRASTLVLFLSAQINQARKECDKLRRYDRQGVKNANKVIVGDA